MVCAGLLLWISLLMFENLVGIRGDILHLKAGSTFGLRGKGYCCQQENRNALGESMESEMQVPICGNYLPACKHVSGTTYVNPAGEAMHTLELDTATGLFCVL